MKELFDAIDAIIRTEITLPGPLLIGHSRKRKPLTAFRFGKGPFRISLLAGCHADEPTGPRLLRKFVSFLSQLEAGHPLIEKFSWWIVPHANPDGEAVNKKWHTDADTYYDFEKYIQFVHRELPGDDVEFGFPTLTQTKALRPENEVIFKFWQEAEKAFHLHLSLHSMGIAFGPWFLIEPAWAEKAAEIKKMCTEEVRKMGYVLHDMERNGEKGFSRLGKGFCTRPDSRHMKAFFLKQGDTETAGKFYPSSMEAIRSLGGNCLTLVSEMPLFIIPKRTDDVHTCTHDYFEWREKLKMLKAGTTSQTITTDISQIKPMPVEDQMRLQLVFLASGIAQIERS